jgi:hypothetical protein
MVGPMLKRCLLAIVVLAACKTASTPAPVQNTGEVPGDDEPVAVSAGECQADADCVVSCARPDDCCDQLCGPCEQVFLATELAELEQWRADRCGTESCPVARCARPTEETFARCADGACVLERRPL